MKSIYDYKNNISVVTTPNGDKVITMNEAILTKLTNRLWDASDYQRQNGNTYSAEDTLELRRVLVDKEAATNDKH